MRTAGRSYVLRAQDHQRAATCPSSRSIPQAYFNQLAVKPGQSSGGPFAAKPPFWERPMFVLWTAAAADPAAEEARFVEADPKTWAGIKTAYDRSRRTVTRTGGAQRRGEGGSG